MIDPTRILPVSAKVDVASLRALAGTWARRETGVVTSGAGERTVIVAGDAGALDGPDRLVRAICMPGLRFQPGEVEHSGITVPFGGLLIEAARLVSNPRALKSRTDVLVSEGPDMARARHRLPLPGVTQGLLSQVLRSGLTLADALRAEGVGIGVVADDLAALVALRFLRLERVPSRPDEDSAPPWNQPSLELALPDPAAFITLRLEREWSLFEEADDYAVLGLSPGLSKEQLRAAGARMAHRYRSLADRDDLSDDARDLGRRLLQRVERAVDRLERGERPPKPAPGASGVQALRMGWVAVEEKNFAEARRWFQRGRRDPRTAPASMAGLGWSELIDPTSPPEARQDAMELLRIAAEVEPGDARIQWLLAEASRMQAGSEASGP